MTHRVSAIDDHRRIVPGRASAPTGSRIPATSPGRRAARRRVPALGRAASGAVPTLGRVLPAVGRVVSADRSAARRARVARP
ncbi:hypothetical protein ACWENR_26250 [Micromonospora sp. NPDC004336]